MRLTVRVHPRARTNRLAPAPDGGLEIWTTAPASDGRANEAVVRMIAEWKRVPPSAVAIVVGARSRTKIVSISE